MVVFWWKRGIFWIQIVAIRRSGTRVSGLGLPVRLRGRTVKLWRQGPRLRGDDSGGHVFCRVIVVVSHEVPPLRFAPVGMTIGRCFCGMGIDKIALVVFNVVQVVDCMRGLLLSNCLQGCNV